jgi:UPF0716 protein FxsA
MSLVKWAIFGLLMLPFLEIAIFVAVALKFGVLTALALTILTSLIGMAIIRNAGQSDVQRVRTAFGERTIRHTELDAGGMLTVLGGFLLVIPGFLTDIVGALLLLPATRRLIGATLRHAIGRAMPNTAQPGVVDLAPDEWQQVADKQLANERAKPVQDRGEASL